jgi:hypothetical protein
MNSRVRRERAASAYADHDFWPSQPRVATIMIRQVSTSQTSNWQNLFRDVLSVTATQKEKTHPE